MTLVRVPELRARGTGIVPLLIARALRDFGDGFDAAQARAWYAKAAEYGSGEATRRLEQIAQSR